MGGRLSKVLSTSQRKINFIEWLMETFKDIYIEEWGDRGGVTEGLVQHQPPCQALTIPSLIQ